MIKIVRTTSALLAFIIAVPLTVTPVLADNPWGKGKGKGHERDEQREHRGGPQSALTPGAGV